MKRLSLPPLILLAILLSDLQGGDKNPPFPPGVAEPFQSASSRHRFYAGLSVLGGAEVRFGGLGDFTNLRNMTLGTAGGERVYDNGFVRPDSANNADGLTWNWGYVDNAQWDVAGDRLLMKTDNSTPSLRESDEDTAPGFELGYGAVLGEFNGDRQWLWGVRAHFAYHHLSTSGRVRLRNDVERTTDAFGLGGVIPPQAPYTGTFSGPGPLLDSQATRSISTISGLALVDAELESEANLFSLGIGPFVEISLPAGLQLDFGLGGTATWIDSRMEVDQTVTIPGLEGQRSRGSDSASEMIFGVYSELGVSYTMAPGVWLRGSARWQTMESFSQGSGGFKVDYDFDSLFVVNLGLVWQL